VIIRCERCSTLYELDEALLAPEGSPVQCTRCQAVFSARPPRPASALDAGATTPGRPGSPAAPAATPLEATPAAATAPSSSTAPAPAPALPPPAAPARTSRSGPNVYRPPAAAPSAQSTAQAAGRATSGRRGTVGAFEARAQRATRWRRLLLPTTGVLLVAMLAGGTVLWRRRPDPEALRLGAEAAARLTQDDTGSLARAVQLYDALLVRVPSRREALADRALARLLMAAAQEEEAEPLADQLAGRVAERERLQGEQPAGADDAQRLLAVEINRLEGELGPRHKAAEALTAQAAGELKALAGSPGGDALAARGLAVAAALAGDREETTRLVGLARARGADPWIDLAEAWLEVRSPGGRVTAQVALDRLVKEHPELLRARYLLARAQATGGRREEAIATVAGLLAANPRHERAQRLKAQLTTPPPPPPSVSAPSAPPPAAAWRRPAPLPVAPPTGASAAPPAAAPTPTSVEAPLLVAPAQEAPVVVPAPAPPPALAPIPPPAKAKPPPAPEEDSWRDVH